MVTEAGTVAALVLLEVSVTVTPPAGACPVRVTVPEADVPPITEVGVTPGNACGASTSSVALLADPYVAVMTAFVFAESGIVVTVNVPVLAPAAMVVDAGTVATAVLPEARVTDAPPVGAGVAKVSVPVAGLPPKTLVALSVKVTLFAAVTVSDADCGVPLSVPVMLPVAF